VTHEPAVFIVDDDASVRKSFGWLLEPLGLPIEMYASVQEFLDGFA